MVWDVVGSHLSTKSGINSLPFYREKRFTDWRTDSGTTDVRPRHAISRQSLAELKM